MNLREFSRRGGLARAKALDKARRVEIAAAAGRASAQARRVREAEKAKREEAKAAELAGKQ